ncbi:hypothetical protein CEXT_793191 [Caerostris extrusa]|uniref:Uncharacterized protein n=1 Tax=Caerostris extrusa TaxID=172846 RepID=A0AAV4V5D4_CAEEX|nr:hypothetical protein CEXT_793191 [Caerostris extrusa]
MYGIASSRGIVYLGTPTRAPGKPLRNGFFAKSRAFPKIKPKLPSISERERGDRLMIPSLQSHRHFGTSETEGWSILASSLSKNYGIASSRGIVYLGRPARAPGKPLRNGFFLKSRAFSKIKPRIPSISERERGDRLMIPSHSAVTPTFWHFSNSRSEYSLE